MKKTSLRYTETFSANMTIALVLPQAAFEKWYVENLHLVPTDLSRYPNTQKQKFGMITLNQKIQPLR